MKIKELLEKIKIRRIKRQVLKALIHRYQQDLELEFIMEKWIIKRILDGQTDRRKELSEKQARIKEMQMFIEYFKSL
jgi:hypothetical protein